MSDLYRERVFKTLNGETPDRTPCGEFFIADEFVRALIAESGAATLPPTPLAFRHYQSVVEQLGLDIAAVSLSAGWGALEQPDQDRALDLLVRWREQGDHFIVALIDGPFSAAVQARGLAELMHYVRGAPHVARELVRRGVEETRVVAQAVRDAGADGVVLGEDIAYGRSTYLAPGDLRELYFPELRAVVEGIHALGLAAFFHSDGNLHAVLPDLAGCGLDGIQGLEPEAGMDLASARASVGPQVTLWGNLGYDLLRAPRTDREIAAALGRAEASRYILGSSPGLVQGMHVATVRRVYAQATRGAGIGRT